jgi:hypothetical protein
MTSIRPRAVSSGRPHWGPRFRACYIGSYAYDRLRSLQRSVSTFFFLLLLDRFLDIRRTYSALLLDRNGLDCLWAWCRNWKDERRLSDKTGAGSDVAIYFRHSAQLSCSFLPSFCLFPFGTPPRYRRTCPFGHSQRITYRNADCVCILQSNGAEQR